MQNGSMKVLVIEDNLEMSDTVALCLNMRWPQTELVTVVEGKRGIELVEEESPDLVVLDIGLPDIGGLEVLRGIRAFSDVPVVMLTVQNHDVEIARYLEEGADDYVVKPFSHVEFMGRIQAVTRRANGRMGTVAPPVLAGDLAMDFAGAEVCKAGVPVNLTRTEIALLEHLVRNANVVMTYRALAANVLQVKTPDAADSRLIKVHTQHLRAKLGDSVDNPKYIANVYGVGYKFLPRPTSGVTGLRQWAGQPVSAGGTTWTR